MILSRPLRQFPEAAQRMLPGWPRPPRARSELWKTPHDPSELLGEHAIGLLVGMSLPGADPPVAPAVVDPDVVARHEVDHGVSIATSTVDEQ